MLILAAAVPARPVQAGWEPGSGITPRFDRLTIADGLAQNTVQAVLQDERGTIWIATPAGLNRYDGYTFTLFTHDPEDPGSLSARGVFALMVDSRGELWAGTAAGLDRFSMATQQFQHFLPGLTRPVTTILEDSTGRIWAGTAGDGLWVLDPSDGNTTQLRHDPENPSSLLSDTIHDLLLDSTGSVWIATNAGLERFDPQSGGFQHYVHARENPYSPSANEILTVIQDRKGMLWLGTDGGGINRVDPATGRFIFYLSSTGDPSSLSGNQVSALLEDSQGRIWAAAGGVLNLLDLSSRSFTRIEPDPRDPTSLPGEPILSLFEDRSGVMWIGTRNSGLVLHRPAANRFGLLRLPDVDGGPLLDGSVPAMAVDPQQRLWLASRDGRLLRQNPSNGQWENVKLQADIRISTPAALLFDQQGMLWVATSGSGLLQIDPRTGQGLYHRFESGNPASLPSNDICCLAEDSDGRVWVGTTSAGLHAWDPAAGGFQHYRHNPQEPASLADDHITTLAVDFDGNVWVGTENGGVSLVSPAGSVSRLAHDPQSETSLDSNRVTSLAAARDGRFWVGTETSLNHWDPVSRTFRRFPLLGRPGGDSANCIQPASDGSVWVSTIDGLLRLDPLTGQIRAFGTADGLQDREFLRGSCLENGGKLIFGGVSGANLFDPAAVIQTIAPPPVRITAFHSAVGPSRFDLADGETLRVAYPAGWITFEFAALDYNAPEKHQYAYQLVGVDSGWVTAGTQRTARYPDLRPGEYLFRVKAANGDGVWNETGAQVGVIIPPPFWQTAPFLISAAVVFLGLLFGGTRWRVSRIEAQNRILEQQVAELSEQVRTAAVAGERTRLARDLHDSVTQSLYSLALLAEAGQRALENEDLGQGKAYGTRVTEIAQQTLQEMRLMLYQLRPPALETGGLAAALESRLEAVERRAGLQARLVVEGEPDLPPDVEEQLYYMAQEALNNALKHSGADCVSVLLRKAEGQDQILEIRDNGRGFDPARAAKSGGCGLTNLRERAVIIGALLEIQTSPGQGSVVRVEIPGSLSNQVDTSN